MTGPLVVAGDTVGRLMAGPGIRALEIARALGERGVDVTLAVPGGTDLALPFRVVAYGDDGASLREAAEDATAVVVGGMVLPRLPFLAALERPVVVDLYGPYVLENLPAAAAGGPTAAGRARRHAGDVAALATELARGDFFVCASERQRDYWLGALTVAGRVSPSTYADDPTLRRLIDVVPFGVPAAGPPAARRVLRGVVPGIGAGDRIVLWAGGLWDWLDPLTLVRAVGDVAARRPELRLVFLGTRTPGANVPPMTMPTRARELAADLGLLDRVVFFLDGWVPYDERAAYLLEADVGASCHGAHVETRYAFRTRLLDYVWAGLPMLVGAGDVLGDEAAARGVARAVPSGDVGAAAAALEALLDRPGGKAAFAGALAAWRAELAWPRAIAPLAGFLAAPRRAPDARGAGAFHRQSAPTPVARLPLRAVEVLRSDGLLAVAEEAVRYVRWRRRPR